MWQSSVTVTKDREVSVSIFLYDSVGTPVTGLSVSDVRVTFLKQSGTSFYGLTLDSTSFAEVGNGLYSITLQDTDVDTTGVSVLRVTPDPAYVGTLRQSTKLVYVSEEDGAEAGLVEDREHRVPVLLSLSSVAVGGLTHSSFSTARYVVPGGSSFQNYALTSSSFREVLDGVDVTGVYQVLVPYTDLATEGAYIVELDSATIDYYRQEYPVVSASLFRTYVVVKDFENDNVPVTGVTVHVTDETTGLVVSSKLNDGLGALTVDLPVGTYRLTKTKGTQIFQSNNTRVQVQNPDMSFESATSAILVSGSSEPFSLSDGSTLQIQVGGGEIQTITLKSTDFPPTSSISSTTAGVLGEILTKKGHSFTAYAGGLNSTRLVIEGNLYWIKENQQTEQQISLSKTTPYFQKERIPARGARVQIIDQDENSYAFQEEGNSGRYFPLDTVPYMLGGSYMLEIEYEGQFYEGSEELNSVASIFKIEQDSIAIFGNNAIQLEAYSIDNKNERNYSYFEFSSEALEATEYNLFRDDFSNGGAYYGVVIDRELKKGDQIRFRQYSLSKIGYSYWYLLLTQNTQQGGPFQTNPANLNGNMINLTNPENNPLGYFSVSEVSEINYTVK